MTDLLDHFFYSVLSIEGIRTLVCSVGREQSQFVVNLVFLRKNSAEAYSKLATLVALAFYSAAVQ